MKRWYCAKLDNIGPAEGQLQQKCERHQRIGACGHVDDCKPGDHNKCTMVLMVSDLSKTVPVQTGRLK